MVGNDITTIGEIAVVYDGPHATPEKIDVGPYFLSISSLENGKLDLSKSAHLSEEQFIKWTRRVTPQEGDLLFSYETRLGDAALVPPNVKCCLGRRMGLLRPDRDKVLPAYLLYAYLSPNFQTVIEQRKVLGSTVDRIAIKELPSFPIRIPPLPEQKAIAHILGSLDDKIELNRRMNGTLEGMAQALFKSWFVDFDPVIDNALVAGNPLPDELAEGAGWAERVETRRQALANGSANRQAAQAFPAAFQFTEEMGWIPEGWEIAAFETVFELPLRNGLTRPKKVRGEGTLMVNMGELFANRRIGMIPMERVPMSDMDIQNSLLRTEDLLFARQSLTLAGAGQVSWIIETGEPLTFEGHLIRCRIDKVIAEPVFFFYLFLSPLGNALVESITNQVAAAGIRGSDLAKLRMVIPPESIQRLFASFVVDMESRIASNLRESSTLTALRDTLLPKLISGELRIPDAEKLAEEALA